MFYGAGGLILLIIVIMLLTGSAVTQRAHLDDDPTSSACQPLSLSALGRAYLRKRRGHRGISRR